MNDRSGVVASAEMRWHGIWVFRLETIKWLNLLALNKWNNFGNFDYLLVLLNIKKNSSVDEKQGLFACCLHCFFAFTLLLFLVACYFYYVLSTHCILLYFGSARFLISFECVCVWVCCCWNCLLLCSIKTSHFEPFRRYCFLLFFSSLCLFF